MAGLIRIATSLENRMPLLKLSAQQAHENLTRPATAWPKTPTDRAARLMPFATPLFTPSFQIDRDTSIFTIGSCFARNIENQLIVEGCKVAAAGFDIPADERDCNALASILNRFICFTILNEFRWALSPDHRFPENGFVELRPGKWFDMNNVHEIAPSSRERVLNRRNYIRRYMSLVAQADVVIMTLGLAEAWYDNATRNYINVAPHRSARVADPDRFEFHLLDYNDIVKCLDDIHEVLKTFGKPGVRLLVTVSPVALGSTFSGNDALVANTYSKSVQRAAVEHFVRKYDDVDYFPSFESVTLSDRNRAWREDQAHASDEIVRINVLRMTRAYLVDARGSEEVSSIEAAYAIMEDGKAHLRDQDMDAAKKAFGKAADLAPEEALIRFQNGKFLFEQKDFAAATREITAATSGKSAPAGAFFLLGRSCLAEGKVQDAYDALEIALNAEPYRAGILSLISQISEKLGRLDDALDFMRRASTTIDANHPHLPRILSDVSRLECIVGSKPTDLAASA